MPDMDIQRNVQLKDYTTMRLGGVAAYFVAVHDRKELVEALTWAEQNNLPVIMIGGGSNVFWRDEGFSGLLIANQIMGYEEQTDDDSSFYVTIGAGENWDGVVAQTVEHSLTGIEALSLVPGTAGATPVQNVGAYGQEVSRTLVELEAYDTQKKQFVTLNGGDLGFGYRTSIFKTSAKGRYFITSIKLHLKRANPEPPFYKSLQHYLDEHDAREYTPQVIRSAVIAIRESKLPDPKQVANNGSFFANPVIDQEQFAALVAKYPDIPHWSTDDERVKIPAGWLVEQAGFKGVHDAETGMSTWPQQALVLVNEHASSTAQLLAFKQKIVDKVQELYGVTLAQEPEILP
jgi:UDP-N-acetylmuramate dehydrogenase